MIRILWILPGIWVSGILYMLISRYLEMDHAVGFSPLLGIMLTGFFGTIIGLLKFCMRPDTSTRCAQTLAEKSREAKVFDDETDNLVDDYAMTPVVTSTGGSGGLVKGS